MAERSPEIAVVVPSHDRPLRLRWLLNALEEQTLPRDRFEVIVGHDSSGPETSELLASHPLAAAGILREVKLPPGTAPPGANRNAAWRTARSDTIVFTDDDCRPPPEWLEGAVEAARRRPGAIVQGAVRPDPEEDALLRAPHRHIQRVKPPTPYGEAASIIYPSAVLERHGGFDEQLYTGEDCDLMVRARRAGTPYLGDREWETFHAVVPMALPKYLWSLRRWKDMPALIRRYPELRSDFPLWVFWKPTHVWLPPAIAAALLERRNPLWALLAVPYLAWALPRHGFDPRGRLRAVVELPAQVAKDATEFGVLAYGAAKHRTFFL